MRVESRVSRRRMCANCNCRYGLGAHVGSTICPKQTVSYGENPVRRLESAEKIL